MGDRPIAAFSVVACGYVLWSCMKVLQGFNTGSNRINCWYLCLYSSST
jgi:hypothetical protein